MIYMMSILFRIPQFRNLITNPNYFDRLTIDLNDEFVISHPGTDYRGEIIYCINEASTEYSGFFSVLNNIISGLCVADRYGFIPYVSQHHSNLYCDDYVSDDFFESFYDKSVFQELDIEQAYNVIQSKPVQLSLCGTNRVYDQYNNIIIEFADVIRKYIRFNPESDRFIKSGLSLLLRSPKVLGIHIRGTDFKMGYKGHSVFASRQEYLEHAIAAMSNNDYDSIFVATDEEESLNMFKKQFGSRIISNEAFRSQGDSDIGIHYLGSNRNNHRHLLGLEVLRDMVCLSACDGLIAVPSGVSFHAMLTKLASKRTYTFLDIIDKGVVMKGKNSRVDIKNKYEMGCRGNII